MSDLMTLLAGRLAELQALADSVQASLPGVEPVLSTRQAVELFRTVDNAAMMLETVKERIFYIQEAANQGGKKAHA